MIRILKSFSIIALLIPQISHAVITSFQVEDAEAGVRTEVMISEVTMEDIDWKLEEFKPLLKAPASVPRKFIYAAPSPQFMADNNWGALIEQEEITQRLSEISFSENTSVELPSEWLNFD